jgi:RNA polymerase sigma-70 factor (ECF subfamily)
MRHGQSEEPGISHDAFATLVEHWQGRLHAFLRDLIGHDEQARDLLQDTFYDAWRSAQKREPPFISTATQDDTRRWLFHVAYNKAISALRRKKRIHWESLDNLAEPLWPMEITPLTFEDVLAESDALRAALAQLSPQDVACLLLRIVHGFSSAEVGVIVGTSTDNVIKRLSRAKQRLRAVYFAQNTMVEEQTRR